MPKLNKLKTKLTPYNVTNSLLIFDLYFVGTIY